MRVFASATFIEDLKQALRCGMFKAFQLVSEKTDVDVTASERTFYADIRESALKYLESRGYSYLTAEPLFFVIGDPGIKGTQKRADGFICDPETGAPVFAIEIKLGGPESFWDDYEKAVREWARTPLRSVFILLLMTNITNESDVELLMKLDSSELRVATNPGFRIHPLILPISSDFSLLVKGYTSYQYLLTKPDYVLRMVTISDRLAKDIVGKASEWTNDILNPMLLKQGKVLENHIVAPEEVSDLLDWIENNKPSIIVLQAEQSPTGYFTEGMRQRFRRFMTSHRPTIVIIGDWINTEDWEKDELIQELLPVRIIGKDHKDGKWDGRFYFGKDIVATPHNVNLTELRDPNHYVEGMVKSELKDPGKYQVEMYAKAGDGQTKYPFLVTDPANKVIFLASGVGGWGRRWFSQYREGYEKLWDEIVKFSRV